MEPNEPWIESLKSSLENYSEELPRDGWERLEEALKEKEKKRRVLWLFPKKGWAAAAAVLLLALVPASLLNDRNTGSRALTEKTQKVSSVSNAPKNLGNMPAVSPYLSANADKPSAVTADRFVADEPSKSTASQQNIAESKDLQHTPSVESDDAAAMASNAAVGTENALAANSEKDSAKAKPYTIDDLLRDEIKQSDFSSKKKEWQVGLVAAVGGGDKTEGSQQPYVLDDRKYLFYGINGISSAEPDKMEHQLPLSFGLTFSTMLGKGFSAETGVVYSYLASKAYEYGSTEKKRQQLHYLGIPLRVGYTIYSSPRFEVYAAVGVMAEKCVSGRIVGDQITIDLDENKLQWSTNGSAGIQYNLFKHVGLYLEPQVVYYFDNQSPIKNIYKDKPFGVHGRIGLRVTL